MNQYDKYLRLYSNGEFSDIRNQPQRANGYWIPIDVFDSIKQENEKLRQGFLSLQMSFAQSEACIMGLEEKIEKLEQKLAEAVEVIEFYADPYIFDQDQALDDDDCQQDLQSPWRFYSGVRARQFLAKENK